jgi:hypothetical protein
MLQVHSIEASAQGLWANVMGPAPDIDIHNAPVHNEQRNASKEPSAVGSGSEEGEIPE